MGRVTRTAAARVAAAVAVLATTMGCDGVEPPRYTSIDDADAFTSTRAEVKTIFDTARSTTSEALGGEDPAGGDRVVDFACDELYDKEFRKLEMRGSFVVRGRALEAVAAEVRRTWEKQGWKVKAVDGDRLLLKTETSTGVRVIGMATLQAARNDAENVAIGLNVGTGCLRVPASVADDL